MLRLRLMWDFSVTSRPLIRDLWLISATKKLNQVPSDLFWTERLRTMKLILEPLKQQRVQILNQISEAILKSMTVVENQLADPTVIGDSKVDITA